jgi:hypothetical protein
LQPRAPADDGTERIRIAYFVTQLDHFPAQRPPLLQQRTHSRPILLAGLEASRVDQPHRRLRGEDLQPLDVECRRRTPGTELRSVEPQHADAGVRSHQRHDQYGLQS